MKEVIATVGFFAHIHIDVPDDYTDEQISDKVIEYAVSDIEIRHRNAIITDSETHPDICT